MSKVKPYTPKASTGAAPATCSECRHWRQQGESPAGRCVKSPPTLNLGVTDEFGDRIGPMLTYGFTRATELACGEAEAK